MDNLIAIITLITSCGVVSFLTFVLTAKQIRREAALKNDQLSVEVLNSVIGELKQESSSRKEEREEYRSDLQTERVKNEDLREENTAVKMIMCTHLGCSLRQPMMGQGDKWYQAHKDDPSLGADYLPINQLMRKYGESKKKTDVAPQLDETPKDNE